MAPPDRFMRGVASIEPKSWFDELVKQREPRQSFAVVFCEGPVFHTIAKGDTGKDVERIALSIGVTYKSTD